MYIGLGTTIIGLIEFVILNNFVEDKIFLASATITLPPLFFLFGAAVRYFGHDDQT